MTLATQEPAVRREHADPHSVLGAHSVDDALVGRASVPQRAVSAYPQDDRRAQTDPPVWRVEGVVEGAERPLRYRLEVDYDGASSFTIDDPSEPKPRARLRRQRDATRPRSRVQFVRKGAFRRPARLPFDHGTRQAAFVGAGLSQFVHFEPLVEAQVGDCIPLRRNGLGGSYAQRDGCAQMQQRRREWCNMIVATLSGRRAGD